jgi:hypothetical protein
MINRQSHIEYLLAIYWLLPQWLKSKMSVPKKRLAIHDTEANRECSSEISGAKRLCCPSPDIEG